MKKLLLIILVFTSASLMAQVTGYTCVQGTGTYIAISGGTTHTTGTTDYGTYTSIALGFTFKYNCVDYTTVSINNDGFIALGNSVDGTYIPLTSSSSTCNNVIAALASDLVGTATGSYLKSQMSGTAPNRIFKIEWKDYKDYNTGGKYSFEIILKETTNAIECIYTTATAAAGSFQVGLRGSSTTDINIRSKASTDAWSASVSGAVGGVMATGNNAARNPSGNFVWTPPAACTGTPIAGTATANPTTLTCSSPTSQLAVTGSSASCGLTYKWQSAPDNATWVDIPGATSATYAATPVSTTYYRRVTTCVGSANSVSVLLTVPSRPANDDCIGAIAVTANAYSSCTSTVSGDVACATPSGVPVGACGGTPDKDVWYKFTPTSSNQFFVLTSAMDAYMQVFSGSCGSLTSIVCSDDNSFSYSGFTVGQTYYIRIYYYYAGAVADGTFTFCIQNPPQCPAALGSGNVAIASLPYNGTALTTCGAGNEITTTNAATCGSVSYFSDLDKVFTFTAATTGSVSVTLNSTQTYTGVTMYDGCPFSSSCVGFVQNSNSGSKSFCTTVVAGVTYYVVVDSYGTSGGCITAFTLSITAPTASSLNDLPCSAIALALGSPTSGNNACTTGTGEPGKPACWTTGVLNTLWYSFVATSSTMYVSTTTGTLTSTQIAVYSGTCSAMTLVGCNVGALSSGCGSVMSSYSTLDMTGLTVGATYYVRVDGTDDLTGTFTVTASAGVSSLNTPVPGQDCVTPLLICNSTMTVGNPGYQGTGSSCDFADLDANCTNGEKNSVWYQLNIAATGNLNFTIVPNDYTSTNNGTDYDFIMWRMSGTGATTNCTSIISSGGADPIACNFDPKGVTGLAPLGNTPAPYLAATFDYAFEPTVNVTAGDVIYLVIQNYTGSSSGFTLDFTSSGAGVVNYTSPSTVSWTGGAGTAWDNAVNWGSCSAYPICGINAIVTTASANQPNVATGIQYVKSLTINPGATLTLAAGTILHVCGDFTNNGTLNLNAGSTVIFDGTNTVQTISGNFTGANKFGNFEINKTGGSVILNNPIDIAGNFTITNGTSVLNTNQQTIRLAGNFSNFNGNTTYTGTGTDGVLEFNGSGIQNYSEGTSQLDLNKVIISNTAAAGSGVKLLTNMFVKAVTGSMTLTQGTITTGAFRVNISNTSPNALNTGTTSSFIDGNLRRLLASTLGTYEWPVGNVAKGYQRATTVFSASSANYIDARFDAWPVGAGYPPIQGETQCATTFSYAAENNGYWTLQANTLGTPTIYNMTLYPLNATNTTGMAGWTIMKKPDLATGGWTLNGNCVASTAAVVKRNNINGFSIFGVAQSVTPLPIELLSFEGHTENEINYLEWVTSSEINNDFFTLERSSNGLEFTELAQVDGAGNSSGSIRYDKYDYAPYPGVTYYRLKQTDFNGVFTYSNVIALTNGLNEISMGSVSPNPASGDAAFDFFSPVNGKMKLTMLDNTGRIIMTRTESIILNNTKINLPMHELSKGVYTLEVLFDKTDFSSTVKIVKN